MAACKTELLERVARGMFAEGFDLDDCDLVWTLQVSRGGVEEARPLEAGLAAARTELAKKDGERGGGSS